MIIDPGMLVLALTCVQANGCENVPSGQAIANAQIVGNVKSLLGFLHGRMAGILIQRGMTAGQARRIVGLAHQPVQWWHTSGSGNYYNLYYEDLKIGIVFLMDRELQYRVLQVFYY
jgi:hypothetical protein